MGPSGNRPGLSRAALGQRAGVAWEVVMACETGRNHGRGWRQIATALGFDLHVLLRQAEARAWAGPQGHDHAQVTPPADPAELRELTLFVSELAKGTDSAAAGS
jgi:hypothetical protein